MQIKAVQKYTRQTPRKVRLVANAVKKMPLDKAIKQLAIIERRSTLVIMKVIKQAAANAINNHGLKFEDLVLDSILVTEGPRYRRMRAVSRGRGHEVKKRTSHITVVLSTANEQQPRSAAPAQKPTVSTKPAVSTKPTALAKSASSKSVKSAKTTKKTAKPTAKKTTSTNRTKSKKATT